MSSKFDEQTDLYIGRYLDSSFSYWSSLLAFKGIILAFFSTDIFINPSNHNDLIYFLVGSCFASIVIIIINYRAIRSFYFKQSKTTVEDIQKIMDEGRIDEITSEDQNFFKRKQMRDLLLDILLFFESLLLLILIFSK